MLYRKEYWPYGTGQEAVDALLTMMNDALAKHRARAEAGPDAGVSPTTGGDDTSDAAEVPPEDPEGRERWIAAKERLVGSADEIARRDALRHLLVADVEGDTVGRVLALLDAYEKQTPVLVDIARELGRPGLEAAVKPLCDLLSHKEPTVRAHAAVSLEYVGSKEAVKALSARAKREKDPATANHMYRALGRCGAYDTKVRAILLKAITGADSEFASFGPIIGLSYFVQDEKTARALEKTIQAVGMPSGGRGGWQGAGKRSLLAWCLTEVGFEDAKAAAFFETTMIPAIPDSRWARTLRSYYQACRDLCNGDEEARPGVENSARRSVSGGGAGGRFGGTGSGNPSLTDDARLHRTHFDFTPKGEFGPIGG